MRRDHHRNSKKDRSNLVKKLCVGIQIFDHILFPTLAIPPIHLRADKHNFLGKRDDRVKLPFG